MGYIMHLNLMYSLAGTGASHRETRLPGSERYSKTGLNWTTGPKQNEHMGNPGKGVLTNASHEPSRKVRWHTASMWVNFKFIPPSVAWLSQWAIGPGPSTKVSLRVRQSIRRGEYPLGFRSQCPGLRLSICCRTWRFCANTTRKDPRHDSGFWPTLIGNKS